MQVIPLAVVVGLAAMALFVFVIYAGVTLWLWIEDRDNATLLDFLKRQWRVVKSLKSLRLW